MKKVFEFELDTKRSCLSRLNGIVDGDTENEFVITVTDDGVPVNIPSSNTRVDAKFVNAEGKISTESGVDYDDYCVTIDVNHEHLSAGVNTVELVVYQRADAGSQYNMTLTTQTKEIYVRQKKE